MKKMLFILSICTMINPTLSIYASNTCSKHHKKTHHHSIKKAKKTSCHLKKNRQKHLTENKTIANKHEQVEKQLINNEEQNKNAEPLREDDAVKTIATEPETKGAEKKPSWLDNMSGTYDITSNYVFRGVSQSANLPAVQGGLTYSFPVGLYLNVWGSNVKFTGTDATVEIDTIAGWRGEVGENFRYDINVDRYNYPGTASLNYNELIGVFGYRVLQFTFGYSANAYNTHQTGTYYNLALNFDIPPRYFFKLEDVSLGAATGHYSLPRAAGNSYNDYSISLNKKLNDTYTLMAQWTSTNHKQKIAPYDDSHLLGMLTANF